MKKIPLSKGTVPALEFLKWLTVVRLERSITTLQAALKSSDLSQGKKKLRRILAQAVLQRFYE